MATKLLKYEGLGFSWFVVVAWRDVQKSMGTAYGCFGLRKNKLGSVFDFFVNLGWVALLKYGGSEAKRRNCYKLKR